jgi:hypothetical protein
MYIKFEFLFVVGDIGKKKAPVEFNFFFSSDKYDIGKKFLLLLTVFNLHWRIYSLLIKKEFYLSVCFLSFKVVAIVTVVKLLFSNLIHMFYM